MPTVQRAQREVTEAPIPGVRKTAAKTAISEGAGVEVAKGNIGESVAGLGGTVARFGVQGYADIQQEARRRADSVAVLNAERQLSEWENKRLYDPNTGALTVRGKDAMALPDQLRTEFDNLAGELEKNLGSDRQREAFQHVKQSRAMGLDLNIQRHVFNEMNRYEQEELEGVLDAARSAAGANALTPERVGAEIDRGVAAIKEHAPRFMSPKAVEAKILKFQTESHADVIDRLLANDQDKAAKIYFEEARDAGQIEGHSLPAIEKAIEAGGIRGESQRQADKIITSGASIADQLEQVKKIEDPKLRDAVSERVEHAAALKDREDRAADESLLDKAYDKVRRSGGNLDVITPAEWVKIGSRQPGLRAYALTIAKGDPEATDWKTYYAQMQAAGTNPAEFAKTNLLELRHKLGNTEFKQLVDLQLSIRNGEQKAADKVLDGFRSNTQIWEDVLDGANIDKGSEEAVKLRKEIDRRVEQWQQDTGKKATNEQVQQIADNLVGKVVLQPGGWGNIFPGGAPFYDVTKRAVDITIADVPAGQRAAVEQKLRQSGIKVTEDAIVDTWLRAKRRAGEIK